MQEVELQGRRLLVLRPFHLLRVMVPLLLHQ
jgi:hypothetical protein